MGLNAATGEPVLCIWILDAKILSVTDVKGIDYCISIPYDSSKTMEENMGEDKEVPKLPVWKFRGELITGLMCMYPKISIRSEILTEALKYLDQLNIFERIQDCPTPFGLLDGHGSILQLPLMEYIKSTTPDEKKEVYFHPWNS